MTTLIKLTCEGKPCIVHAAAVLDAVGVYYFPQFARSVLIKPGAVARFSTNTAKGVCTVLAVDNTARYPLKLEYDVAGVGKRIEVFHQEELTEWVPLN